MTIICDPAPPPPSTLPMAPLTRHTRRARRPLRPLRLSAPRRCTHGWLPLCDATLSGARSVTNLSRCGARSSLDGASAMVWALPSDTVPRKRVHMLCPINGETSPQTTHPGRGTNPPTPTGGPPWLV